MSTIRLRTAQLLCAACALLPLSAWPTEPAAASPDPAAPATPIAPAAPVALVPIAVPKPVLPDTACQQRLSGWVELDFAVLPDGKVADVRVASSQPAGVFDAAAVDAVTGRLYPAQPEPVKLHERLIMTFADCKADQLKRVESAAGPARSAEECYALAATGRRDGERFEAAESGRAILAGAAAQAHTAPSTDCPVAGKLLKPGSRWTAHVEYDGFSLLTAPRREEGSGVWVRSSQLKDTDPPPTAATPEIKP